MITVKDLEAIGMIKAFIAEQGYTDIRASIFNIQGEPAWCFRGGQPAQIAAAKCPRAAEDGHDKIGEGNHGAGSNH